MSLLILIEIKLVNDTIRNCLVEISNTPAPIFQFFGLPLKKRLYSAANPVAAWTSLREELHNIGAKILSMRFPSELFPPPVKKKPDPGKKTKIKDDRFDELYMGQTLLGRLTGIDYDFPVVYADLQPTKAYHRYQARFVRATKLYGSQKTAQWIALMKKLDHQGLRIKMPDGLMRRFDFPPKRGQGFAYLQMNGRKVSWRPT